MTNEDIVVLHAEPTEVSGSPPDTEPPEVPVPEHDSINFMEMIGGNTDGL